MNFQKTIGGVAVLCALILSGCSSTPSSTPKLDASDHSTVKARIDPAAETVELPLDDYVASRDEARTIDSANRAMRNECITAEGVAIPAGAQTLTFIPHRPYGVWTMDAATKYGYEIPTSTPEGSQPELTQAYMDAYQMCSGALSDKMLPLMRGSGGEGQIELTAQGKTDSLTAAMQDPLWASVYDEWATCLTDHGVALAEGERWTPVLAEDDEARIRTATIDVECKNQSDLVQTLADLEAGYQAAFIEMNEAALNAQRQKKDDVVAEAREVLSRYGK